MRFLSKKFKTRLIGRVFYLLIKNVSFIGTQAPRKMNMYACESNSKGERSEREAYKV